METQEQLFQLTTRTFIEFVIDRGICYLVIVTINRYV